MIEHACHLAGHTYGPDPCIDSCHRQLAITRCMLRCATIPAHAARNVTAHSHTQLGTLPPRTESAQAIFRSTRRLRRAHRTTAAPLAAACRCGQEGIARAAILLPKAPMQPPWRIYATEHVASAASRPNTTLRCICTKQHPSTCAPAAVCSCCHRPPARAELLTGTAAAQRFEWTRNGHSLGATYTHELRRLHTLERQAQTNQQASQRPVVGVAAELH